MEAYSSYNSVFFHEVSHVPSRVKKALLMLKYYLQFIHFYWISTNICGDFFLPDINA